MVVEKKPGVQVRNEIGQIFRQHNLFEFKSPEDALGIDEFAKAMAYVLLYKAEADHANERPLTELSLTMVRAVRPVKLFDALRSAGNAVEETFPGIYYVTGQMMFPVQIIVTSRLQPASHATLRVLRNNAEEADVMHFLTEARSVREQGDLQNIDAVLQVSLSANNDVYDLLKRRDPGMCQALREFMKEEIEDEVQKAQRDKQVTTLAAAVMNIKKVLGFDSEKAMELVCVPSELREAVLAALG